MRVIENHPGPKTEGQAAASVSLPEEQGQPGRYLTLAAYSGAVLVVVIVGWVIAYFNGYITWPLQEPSPPPLADDPQAMLEAAINEFQRAIELEPGNPEGYRWLSKAYQLAGQPEAALEVYQQAVRNNPGQAWPLIDQGTVLLDAGQQNEGIIKLAEASSIDSTVNTQIGFIFLKYQLTDKAQEYFEQALSVDSQDMYAYIGLSQVHRQLRNLEQAEIYARQALGIGQNGSANEAADAHYELGWVYQEQGKTDEALTQFLSALEKAPQNARFYATVGDFYRITLNEPGKAIRYYRQAINLEPLNGWHHASLGKSLIAAGDLTAGQKALETALSLAGNDLELYLNLGQLAIQAQAWEQARQIYEQAINRGVVNADIYMALGDVYNALNNPDQALANYQKAAQLAPDNPQIQQRLQGNF